VFVEKVNESIHRVEPDARIGRRVQDACRCGVDFCKSEFRGMRANTTLLKVLLGPYCWKRKRGRVDIKREIEKGAGEKGERARRMNEK